MEFEFLSRLVSKMGDKNIPLWGQFELLPVCNLNCRMCYIHDPAKDRAAFQNLLPASFWINIARQAVDAGMLVLSITGGETLLYPELDTLLKELSRMGLLISFNTNGTLIDEKQAARLAGYSPAKINLTLYGASDETYRKVTGLADGFSRICRAIDVLQAAGQNVYLNGVLTPDNQDDLPEMMNYAASKGLVLHEASYLFPRREASDKYDPNTVRLSPEDAAGVWTLYSKLAYGEHKYRQSAAFAVFRDYCTEKNPDRPMRSNECRAGKYSFAVNWHGELQPCVLFAGIREDLKGETFATAWKNCVDRMGTLAFPKKCATCAHLDSCTVCRAAIYTETGRCDEAPEYLCRYTEELIRIWRKDSRGIEIHIKNQGKLLSDLPFKGCEG